MLTRLGSDRRGNTELHLAASHSNLLKVDELITSFATHPNKINLINQVNCDGETALHKACEVHAIEVVKLLTSHGADDTVVDNKGIKPADYYQHFPDLDVFYIRAGIVSFHFLQTEVNTPYRYQLVAQDRATLVEVVQEINLYLSRLETRNRIAWSSRKLAIGITIGVIGAFLLESYWLIQRKHSHLSNLLFTSVGIGFSYCLTALIEIAVYQHLWNREVRLPAREWSGIVSKVKNQLTDKLVVLQTQSPPVATPVSTVETNGLLIQTAQLKQSLAISEVETLHKSLRDSIVRVMQAMNITQCPLTFRVAAPLPVDSAVTPALTGIKGSLD